MYLREVQKIKSPIKAERGIFMENNKITKAQKLETAKNNVLAMFAEVLETSGAEEVKGFTYAIPTEVAGEERWVEITLTAKDTMTDDEGKRVPYDPFVVQAAYQVEQEIKAAEKAAREKKKAETVKKAEEKRRLAKEKAMAKKSAMEKAKAEIEEKTDEKTE